MALSGGWRPPLKFSLQLLLCMLKSGGSHKI